MLLIIWSGLIRDIFRPLHQPQSYFHTVQRSQMVHFSKRTSLWNGDVRTGKPWLIIIWTKDLGNRSFKVSKWPILG